MRNTVKIQMQLQKEFEPIVSSYFLALKAAARHSLQAFIAVSRLFRYRTLFPYKSHPMPSFFSHTSRSRIQNLSLFWGPHIQKQERKNDYNSTIFWAKNKVRGNFIWEKLMDSLLLDKVFQNLIFSNYRSKKWLYNTNSEQILNSKS